jgi:hypothetical protein
MCQFKAEIKKYKPLMGDLAQRRADIIIKYGVALSEVSYSIPKHASLSYPIDEPVRQNSIWSRERDIRSDHSLSIFLGFFLAHIVSHSS